MSENIFPGGFAVLMSVYYRDKTDLFEMAVNSVFANTLAPSQFLIVVDGAIPDTLEQAVKLLSQLYGNRLEILRLPINQGLANALNEGLKHIKYPWVVRADADDYNLPHRFAVLATMVANKPDIGLMGSAILEVDEFRKPIAIRQVPKSEAEIRHFVMTRNPFNHMAVAYLRDCVLACGGYPNVHLKEDYALWCLMLARKVPVANTIDVLVHATAGRNMYRRRGGWRYARVEWEMQSILVTCGLKGKFRAIIDGSLRALVFLAPAWLRGQIYERVLRKPT
jgi:glycosyltransferase involved in cell wall biosynthesis